MLVTGVPAEQLPKVQDFRGPKAEIAFAADGTLTKAGAGFARSKGAAAEDIRREVINGTEFVLVSVEAERRTARDVMPGLVSRLITGLQIPRGMRWGAVPEGASDYLRFSRIRWLVAKLDGETLSGSFYGLPLGDVSRGHRVLGASVTIAAAGDYERLLEERRSSSHRPNGAGASSTDSTRAPSSWAASGPTRATCSPRPSTSPSGRAWPAAPSPSGTCACRPRCS